MKKGLLAVAVLFLGTGAVARAKCLPSTEVAQVGSEKITLSYFNYVKSQIPKWIWDKYYKDDPKELLEKIIDRNLILTDQEKRGFFKKPKIREKIEAFKIKTLAYSYLNSKLKGLKVSQEELKRVLSRYPEEKRTPALIKSLKASLLARKFTSKREEFLREAYSKLKVVNLNPSSLEDPVARYRGREILFKDIKPLLPQNPNEKEIERALSLYSLYLQAKEDGFDEMEDFKDELESFKESLAVEEFKRELFLRVKVSKEEVYNYYKSHKKEFKIPETAEVKVVEVSSLEEGKRLLEEVKKGVPLKERGRLVEVRKGEDNPISLFVFGIKKNVGLLRLPDGRTVLIKVLEEVPPQEFFYGDVYWKIRSKLYSEKVKRTMKEELSKLRREFKVREMNLKCLGEKDSS